MSPRKRREFAARMAALAEAVDFVEAAGEALGVGRDERLRLALIVEELFTNTVEHGHGGDSDASITVELFVDGDRLVLHYEDRAPPFDPRERADPADLQGDVDERRVGGLGVHLITRFAARIDHAHDGGGNRLRLELRVER